MYEIRDNILTISVNDWIRRGLTENQYRMDKQRSRNVDFSQAEDKNTEGLFLCPAYYPVWKGKLKTKEK